MAQMTFHSPDAEKHAAFTQLARFVVSGIFVTALGVGVYAIVASVARHPQLGNFLAYVVAMATGSDIPSRGGASATTAGSERTRPRSAA